MEGLSAYFASGANGAESGKFRFMVVTSLGEYVSRRAIYYPLQLLRTIKSLTNRVRVQGAHAPTVMGSSVPDKSFDTRIVIR